MSRISVCMATYNGERFVGRQLNSILQQIGPDDEVIISDDGSVDSTLRIIHAFADQRVKVLVNKYRHGVAGNFENALRHSSGDLIFLADQDDIWLPNKVNIISSLLTNHELVIADCRVVDERNNVIQSSFFKLRGSRKGFWKNLYQNSYIGCCMAFRRDILTYVLPFPTRIDVHDWWIGLLVEVKGRIMFCQEPLINYVRHGNNASPTGEIGYNFSKRLANRFFLFVNVVKRLMK